MVIMPKRERAEMPLPPGDLSYFSPFLPFSKAPTLLVLFPSFVNPGPGLKNEWEEYS